MDAINVDVSAADDSDFQIVYNKRRIRKQKNWLKKQSQECSTVLSGTIPHLTNKLPYDVLILLFSWLSLKDLFTVRRVCRSWRTAARCEYLWRNYVLNLKGRPDDEAKVKLMPNWSIAGYGDNSLLNAILDNVRDLRRLNVKFNPPISSTQVAIIIEMYPEIQSITLCTCSPDILECLEILKTSKHLKEVNFEKNCEGSCLSPSDFIEIFSDCENFTALTALDLSGYHFRNSVDDEGYFKNVATDIIVNRSSQLLSLKLNLYYRECSEILNTVTQCVKLQELDLFAQTYPPNFDIGRLTELRSLHLNIPENVHSHATILNSFNCGSWLYLTDISISICFYINESVLRAIIDNVKQLRKLSYEGSTCVDELRNAQGLSKLEYLDVSELMDISQSEIDFISKCYNLKRVKLNSYITNIDDNHPCIIEMLQQLNHLEFIEIKSYVGRHDDDDKNIHLYLKSRKEIEKHVYERHGQWGLLPIQNFGRRVEHIDVYKSYT